MAGEVKDLAWKRKDVTGKLKDLAENGKIDGKTEKFGGKSEDLAGKLKIWLENWKIRRENLRFGGKTERFVGNTLDLAEKLKKRPISSALCTLYSANYLPWLEPFCDDDHCAKVTKLPSADSARFRLIWPTENKLQLIIQNICLKMIIKRHP